MSDIAERGSPVGELRDDLLQLQTLAVEVALAEERLITHAQAMVEGRRYENAAELPRLYGGAEGAVKETIYEARQPRSGPTTCVVSAHLIAQDVQDALDILDMAIARSGPDGIPRPPDEGDDDV